MTTTCSSSMLLISVFLLEWGFMQFSRLMLANSDSITKAKFNEGFQEFHALWRQNFVTVEAEILPRCLSGCRAVLLLVVQHAGVD